MAIEGAAEKLTGMFFDKGGVVFNVQHPDFGAKGDGVADDGVAWNLARAEVPTGGGVILVPPGDYLLTTAFTFASQTNVLLVLQSGVVLTGVALPTATGTNAILDWRSGALSHSGNLTITGAGPSIFDNDVVIGGTVSETNAARLSIRKADATTPLYVTRENQAIEGMLVAIQLGLLNDQNNRVSAGHFGIRAEGTWTSTTTTHNSSLTFEPKVSGLATERGRFNAAGALLIGDDANANMTIGVTINQAANDNQIFCAKSSDVVTGLSTMPLITDVETDDYFIISKRNTNLGGVNLQALAEDDAGATEVFRFQSYGGQANTTKGTTGVGLFHFYATEHDGSNAFANITADGNIFAIAGRVGGANSTLWILDEDGDTWQNGSIEINGDLNHDGANIGFYGTAPVAQQTGVAVTAAGIHAALVNLGLITA